MKNYYACNDQLIDELIADPRYEIRADGTVWFTRCQTTRQTGNAKTRKKGKIYRHLKFKGSNLLVHRIVYRKFIGELDSTLVINHIDGNSLNNVPLNLEMITQRENIIHATEPCYGPKVG